MRGTTTYGQAFSNVFDCALFLAREVSQPFQSFGKTYERVKKSTSKRNHERLWDIPEIRKATEDINETVRGMVGKFNAENATALEPYAFPVIAYNINDCYEALFNCRASAPKPIEMKGVATLFYPLKDPSIFIKGRKKIETKPSIILDALADVDGMVVSGLSIEPRYSRRVVPLAIPVKAFCKEKTKKILDSVRVDVYLKRQTPPNFKSLIKSKPEKKSEVKIDYYDDRRLIGKGTEEIAKEKEWLVQVVDALTSSS